jgi:hypothetical protein
MITPSQMKSTRTDARSPVYLYRACAESAQSADYTRKPRERGAENLLRGIGAGVCTRLSAGVRISRERRRIRQREGGER